MTDTTTRAGDDSPYVDEDLQPLPADPGPKAPRRADTPVEAFFHRVFAFFHNKKVGLLLILAMAILTLIGVLVPQVPADIRSDPVSYADWLAQHRPTFGGWTPVFSTIGVFSMFSSVWFKLVTALLALSIIACTLHRMPLLWRNATRPHLHVTEGFFDHAKVATRVPVGLSPQETMTGLRAILGRRHYRVLEDPRGEGFSLYADRNRWMPFGTAIAHTSFVILLIGVIVTTNTGFSVNLPVTVGTRVPVGHGTDMEVEALSFRDSYHASGEAMDYVAEVAVYDGGTLVEQREIRVNSPMSHKGVRFHQSYFGTSTMLTVRDDAGKTVFSGGVPLEFTSDDEQNSIGRLPIPGTDLVAFVVTPASGQVISDIPAGQAQIEVQRTGQETPVASQRLAAGESAKLGDLTYTFDREAKFTGLLINQDPGAIWIWIGCALMMIGLFTTMGFKHRRVWLRVTPTTDGGSEVRAASSDKADIEFQRWFRSFSGEVARLGGAGAHSGTSQMQTPTTTHRTTHRKTRV